MVDFGDPYDFTTGPLIIGGCDCRGKISNNPPHSIVYYGYKSVRVHQKKYRRRVAVKVISLESTFTRSRLDNYLTELAIFHAIHHPHIVPLIDTQPSDSQIIHVLPYIEGPTVEQAYETYDWPLELIASLVKQMCYVIGDLHRERIIHGDIHAGNIMLRRPFEQEPPSKTFFYLLDFGLAHIDKHSDVNPPPKTYWNDISGLAMMLQMLITKQFGERPDREAPFLGALLPLLIAAQGENSIYTSIEMFERAFNRAIAPYLTSNLNLVEVTTESPTQVLSPDVIRKTAEIMRMTSTPTESIPPVDLNPTRRCRRPAQWSYTVGGLAVAVVLLILLGVGVHFIRQTAPATGKGLMLGVYGNSIALMDNSTSRILRHYPQFSARVYVYSANGRYLAADRAVFQLDSGGLVRIFDDAPMPRGMSVSYDGSIVAIHDGTEVSLWDVHTGDKLRTLQGIGVDEVGNLLSPDGYERLHDALQESR